MAPRKLKVACAGLGRMGARHALHFLNRTPRAELVAAFTPDESELQWARTHLEQSGVKLYTEYDEMIRQKGLEAVVIATITTVHAEQCIKAMKAVSTFCAKSRCLLGLKCTHPSKKVSGSNNQTKSQSVVDAAKALPHLKVTCGFPRGFDASYRVAWSRMDSDDIGRASVCRSQTCDKLDPSGFFVEYARHSGGIFVDCNIHDIDLALWFFGQGSIVKSVAAVGITAVQPELRKYKDVDNGIGIVEFWGGGIAYFYSSRMMAAGNMI
ncbi:MAG: hypothetical protein M1830_010516 [Pleopsidium flavum]|nr:MAG: hypothetical protein M1830_010516 [Pleopsidium flavum]